MSRRRIGQGNLSTFQVSWDTRHDLRPRSEATISFTRPINKTVGAPPALYQAFSLQIFANLKLSFPNQRKSKNHGEQQQQAPRRRQGGRESRFCASEAMIAILSSLLV
jgi:hypothetical protein